MGALRPDHAVHADSVLDDLVARAWAQLAGGAPPPPLKESEENDDRKDSNDHHE